MVILIEFLSATQQPPDIVFKRAIEYHNPILLRFSSAWHFIGILCIDEKGKSCPNRDFINIVNLEVQLDLVFAIGELEILKLLMFSGHCELWNCKQKLL